MYGNPGDQSFDLFNIIEHATKGKKESNGRSNNNSREYNKKQYRRNVLQSFNIPLGEMNLSGMQNRSSNDIG